MEKWHLNRDYIIQLFSNEYVLLLAVAHLIQGSQPLNIKNL